MSDSLSGIIIITEVKKLDGLISTNTWHQWEGKLNSNKTQAKPNSWKCEHLPVVDGCIDGQTHKYEDIIFSPYNMPFLL